MPRRSSAAYQSRASCRYRSSAVGCESCSLAHQESQSYTIPTAAGSRSLPATGASAFSVAPSSATARNRSLSAPACGTIAEWYFSAPAADCRHWKKQTASAPCATCSRESRASSPGRLATFTGCQLTALVECSIRNHGRPPAMPLVRFAEKDSSSRSCGPGCT